MNKPNQDNDTVLDKILNNELYIDTKELGAYGEGDTTQLVFIAGVEDAKAQIKAHYMTGQEWYERFKKELHKPTPQKLPSQYGDDGESHDRFYRAGGTNFMYEQALKAAKKASGIDE